MPAPRCPNGLSGVGQALWRHVIGDVADGWRLDARDFATLESAARALDRAVELERLVDREGLMVEGSKGQRVLHPGVAEARLQRQLSATLVAKVELAPPAVKTGRLSAKQRNQLRDARQARWAPRANG